MQTAQSVVELGGLWAKNEFSNMAPVEFEKRKLKILKFDRPITDDCGILLLVSPQFVGSVLFGGNVA